MYSFKYPSLISIFTTNKCNLKCRHCCFEAEGTCEHELSTQEMKEVIDKIAACGIVCLDFSGGEPFTRSDIFELIEYAYKKGVQSLSVATNTLLLDSDKIKELKRIQDKYSLIFLRLSLDGPDKESHEWLRGEGTFDRTINKIAELRDCGINLREMNTVVSKVNYDKVEDVIKIAKANKVKTSVILPLIPVGRAKDLEEFMISPEQWKELCIKKKHYEEKYQVEIFADSPVSTTLDERNKGKELPCMCGHQFLGIRPNGDYTICPIVSYGDGNIFKDSIEEYWKSSKLLNMVRDIYQIEGKCSECEHLSLCRGGCRGLAYIMNDKMTTPDPLCWL